MRIKKPLTSMRGFTLIELLVVVVIIGVVVGAVALSLNPNQSRAAKQEAQRFIALLSLASQESIITSREMALEWSADEYQFLVYQGKEWVPYQDNTFRLRTLPENIRLSFNVQDEQSLFEDEDEDEEKDEKSQDKPRIYVMSSGEMTPFELTVEADGSENNYLVSGDIGGNLAIKKL